MAKAYSKKLTDMDVCQKCIYCNNVLENRALKFVYSKNRDELNEQFVQYLKDREFVHICKNMCLDCYKERNDQDYLDIGEGIEQKFTIKAEKITKNSNIIDEMEKRKNLIEKEDFHPGKKSPIDKYFRRRTKH